MAASGGNGGNHGNGGHMILTPPLDTSLFGQGFNIVFKLCAVLCPSGGVSLMFCSCSRIPINNHDNHNDKLYGSCVCDLFCLFNISQTIY